jgi:predicted O-methyltransferase YrrM
VTKKRTWDTYFAPLKARLGARKETFEKIFAHLDSCDEPIIVETGTYREENNYTGDGCSTLLFDNYIDIRGKGQLISIDIDPGACELARTSTKHAEVIESDSVEALDTMHGPRLFVVPGLVQHHGLES